jgi:hypothetical protein
MILVGLVMPEPYYAVRHNGLGSHKSSTYTCLQAIVSS